MSIVLQPKDSRSAASVSPCGYDVDPKRLSTDLILPNARKNSEGGLEWGICRVALDIRLGFRQIWMEILL